eukprot:4203269-Amphidinium_carterae.1
MLPQPRAVTLLGPYLRASNARGQKLQKHAEHDSFRPSRVTILFAMWDCWQPTPGMAQRVLLWPTMTPSKTSAVWWACSPSRLAWPGEGPKPNLVLFFQLARCVYIRKSCALLLLSCAASKPHAATHGFKAIGSAHMHVVQSLGAMQADSTCSN